MPLVAVSMTPVVASMPPVVVSLPPVEHVSMPPTLVVSLPGLMPPVVVSSLLQQPIALRPKFLQQSTALLHAEESAQTQRAVVVLAAAVASSVAPSVAVAVLPAAHRQRVRTWGRICSWVDSVTLVEPPHVFL